MKTKAELEKEVEALTDMLKEWLGCEVCKHDGSEKICEKCGAEKSFLPYFKVKLDA